MAAGRDEAALLAGPSVAAAATPDTTATMVIAAAPVTAKEILRGLRCLGGFRYGLRYKLCSAGKKNPIIGRTYICARLSPGDTADRRKCQGQAAARGCAAGQGD